MREFRDTMSVEKSYDFDPFGAPIDMLRESTNVYYGQVLKILPGLQVFEKNRIPEGFDPGEVINESDRQSFAVEPGGEARVPDEESVRESYVTLVVDVQEAFGSSFVKAGDVVSVQVPSGVDAMKSVVGRHPDFDVFLATTPLPSSWATNPSLRVASPRAELSLATAQTPFIDGLWLGDGSEMMGVYTSPDVLGRAFGSPRTLNDLRGTMRKATALMDAK